MKTVQGLASGVPGLRLVRGGERPVERVRVDSRRVEENDLFVAIPGERTDGMRFAAEAIERGACGVVGSGGSPPHEHGAWLVAEDARLAAALLASRAWDDPSSRLDVIGITGTDGKTTTTFLLRAILEAAGRQGGDRRDARCFPPGRAARAVANDSRGTRPAGGSRAGRGSGGGGRRHRGLVARPRPAPGRRDAFRGGGVSESLAGAPRLARHGRGLRPFEDAPSSRSASRKARPRTVHARC